MALMLPETKQIRAATRPFRAENAVFSRSQGRRKVFTLGKRPELLSHLGHVDHKAWKRYQTLLKRKPPLELAEFYAREMKARGLKSYQALSLLLGEPVNRVGRYIKLLDLSEPVKKFLREHRTPEYLAYFTETRLRELNRIANPRAMWVRFQAMIVQAEREAGIWRKE